VVKLPPKATAVLWCLVTQAGQVVTKATLLDTVWAETAVSEGVLSVCMRDLRRALGDDPQQPRYIETVHTRGYRFIAPVESLREPPPAPESAPAPPLPAALAPAGLVGREAEVAQVQACLEQARRGQRQVLFVTGEAGIGKTTLVDACVQAVEAQDGRVGWGQCVDAYGPGTGYLPVLEALGRLCRGPAGPTVLAQLHQWAPTWLAQLAGVLPEAEQARLLRRTLGTTCERRLRELAAALEALTQTHLLVVVLEDLHWSDPSTVDVLTMLARRREPARLLIIGTYRPVELILRAHPLKLAKAELHLHGQCVELALDCLPAPAVAAYVAQHFPAPVAQSIAPVLYQRTAGHPLFMVHLATYLAQHTALERGTGPALMAQVAAVAEAIPPGVQQLIELQLGQWPEDVQRMLEMASVAGSEFAVASVAAGAQMPPERLEERCETLAHQGWFLEACGLAAWPDGTVSGQYRFRHALYQQVLYRRLAAVQRVQGHRRIGARLEAGYGTRAAEMAAVLAGHFARGQDPERAIIYHGQAGQQALDRSAYQEAIGHVTTALALLATLPETPARAQQELDLQMALGPALRATRGYGAPEVEQTYRRADTLSQQLGETAQRFWVLLGLQSVYLNRAEYHTTRALAAQLLQLAQPQPDPCFPLLAHYTMGNTLFYLGQFVASRRHFVQAMRYYDPHQHRALAVVTGEEPGVRCQSRGILPLLVLGYPDQALQEIQQALALSAKQEHPYSVALCRYYAVRLHQFRREVQATAEQAEQLIAFCTAQGFAHYRAQGVILRGWAVAAQGQPEAGIAQMREGLAAYQATQGQTGRPHLLALLAEAYQAMRQPQEALRLLAEALTISDHTAERWWAAELHRLRGELLWQAAPSHPPSEVETCLLQALDIARHQQAKALELRATMSVSRLWQQQGKHAAARQQLAAIYGWFTEGFDTVDLQEAKALLDALGT
jgi:DNA-binding winged helix-turn-helix (wHTH) protein/predicted ATPase